MFCYETYHFKCPNKSPYHCNYQISERDNAMHLNYLNRCIMFE